MGFISMILKFVLFFLDVPAAIALIACVLPYFLFVNNGIPIQLLAQRIVALLESTSLWAYRFSSQQDVS